MLHFSHLSFVNQFVLKSFLCLLAVVHCPFPTSFSQRTIELPFTPIGTPGSWSNHGNTFDQVFDGVFSTYFDAPTKVPPCFVGLDLQIPRILTHITYAPRLAFESRMQYGYFQASNSLLFESITSFNLHQVTQIPHSSQMNLVVIDNSFSKQPFRFVRYFQAPDSDIMTLAEMRVYGLEWQRMMSVVRVLNTTMPQPWTQYDISEDQPDTIDDEQMHDLAILNPIDLSSDEIKSLSLSLTLNYSTDYSVWFYCVLEQIVTNQQMQPRTVSMIQAPISNGASSLNITMKTVLPVSGIKVEDLQQQQTPTSEVTVSDQESPASPNSNSNHLFKLHLFMIDNRDVEHQPSQQLTFDQAQHLSVKTLHQNYNVSINNYLQGSDPKKQAQNIPDTDSAAARVNGLRITCRLLIDWSKFYPFAVFQSEFQSDIITALKLTDDMKRVKMIEAKLDPSSDLIVGTRVMFDILPIPLTASLSSAALLYELLNMFADVNSVLFQGTVTRYLDSETPFTQQW